jgi:hypothetical protein
MVVLAEICRTHVFHPGAAYQGWYGSLVLPSQSGAMTDAHMADHAIPMWAALLRHYPDAWLSARGWRNGLADGIFEDNAPQ